MLSTLCLHKAWALKVYYPIHLLPTCLALERALELHSNRLPPKGSYFQPPRPSAKKLLFVLRTNLCWAIHCIKCSGAGRAQRTEALRSLALPEVTSRRLSALPCSFQIQFKVTIVNCSGYSNIAPRGDLANYHFWLYRVWQHLACEPTVWLADYPVGLLAAMGPSVHRLKFEPWKDLQRVYTRYIHETDARYFHQNCCLVSVGFHPYRNRSQGRRPSTFFRIQSCILRCSILQFDNLNAREALCFLRAESPASGASSHLFWNCLLDSAAQRHCIDVQLQS